MRAQEEETRLLGSWCVELAKGQRDTWAGLYTSPMGAFLSVMDASSTRTYSFLPASWAGDTHEETNILPIGNQEEKGKGLLNHHADSLGTMQVLKAKYLADRVARG